MNRLRELCRLYRIFRQCNGPITAARLAWVLARD
jgi:hypothetical protein